MDGVHPHSTAPQRGGGRPAGREQRWSVRQRWCLAQLGVPLWRLRPTAAELHSAATAAAPAAEAERPAAREPVIRVPEAESRPPAPRREPGRQRSDRGAAAPPTAPQPTLDLVCVRQGTVLLLAPALSVNREEALVRDLMGAAQALLGGDAGRPEEYRFFWPQPGSRGTPERALAAFVDKRRDDADARLLLLCESAAVWLPEPPAQALAMRPLETLALNPSHKRDLWQALWQRQQTVSR